MTYDLRSQRPERLALAALLVATAVLYIVGLASSGYANVFYSAAVQAGSQSWKAFFYGSSDAASSITVDKPPASLWVMALSVRVFGLSSWSVLVPEAIMGVASVAVLWATVRRTSGPAAALLAGAVLALTPVATLVFRYDNPDALLVLLTVGAAWALLRGVSDGRTRWLVLTGVLIGLGFLTKQLQVFLVVPALAVTYLVAGPVPLRRRITQLLAGGGALLATAGWWVAVVTLVPAADRPWVGGSPDNSLLGLTFGYNGLDRILGRARAAGASSFAGPGDFGGRAGPLRLFTGAAGAQIAWLLPAAVLLGVMAVVLRGRAARTDPARASHVMWLVWTVTGTAVFSFMSGTFHEYYTVALAPAVAALVGAGGVAVWQRRSTSWVLAVLTATVLGTGVWAWVLMGRSPEFVPALRWVILAVGVLAAGGLLGVRRLPQRAVTGVAAVAVLVALAGPTAYAVETAGTPHGGSSATAGPALASTTSASDPANQTDPAAGGANSRARGFGRPGISSVSAAVVTGLEVNASAFTWVAATVGSDQAAVYQLATGDPVMPIGGFSGNDPSPSLANFRAYVAAGRIHYFLASEGGQGGPGGGGSGAGGASGAPGGAGAGGAGDNPDEPERTSNEITKWVEKTFTKQTVGGMNVYDLTAPKA